MFAAALSTPSLCAVKPVVTECFRLFEAERLGRGSRWQSLLHGCEECARVRSRSRYARLLRGAVLAGAPLAFLPLPAIFSPRNIFCQTNKHYDFAELNNTDK